VVGELAALVREHPLHELLRGQLMLALYPAGRQDEALRTYQEGRRMLVDQLGVEPSSLLRRLQQRILGREASVDPPGAAGLQRPGSPVATVPRRREAGPGGETPRRTRSPLIGRTRELAELQDLLLRHRLVTLTGPAGIGKTRLALETTARMTEAFPDGTFVVDLTPLRNPKLVAPTACSALGLRPTRQEDAEADLAAFLTRRTTLIVLDNFEHVLPAAGLVSELLGAAPHVTVLIISRAPLRMPREHVVIVPPLAVRLRTRRQACCLRSTRSRCSSSGPAPSGPSSR
jgi:hypothetical protein